jgi:hypothetical protein
MLPVANEDSVSLGGFVTGEEQLVAVFSYPILHGTEWFVFGIFGLCRTIYAKKIIH